MLKINEIFYSIQGESQFVGWPTVFIRLSGCHLRCTYCDTTYAYYDGQMVTLDEIVAQVTKHPNVKHVCVTGGEPLLQKKSHDLMRRLCDQGYLVSIETSGDLSCAEVDRRVHLVVDVKTPDSGEGDRFNEANLSLPHPSIEYKFVICSEADFAWAEEFCSRKGLFQKFNILYSPSFGKIEPEWLAEKILAANSTARLQLQLHKYIWSPHKRGV